EFGESYAGKRYPKAKMNVSGFDDAGNLLPLVTTSAAGPDDAGDQNIMTYSFRLCLTRDPAKMAPMPPPANYDPARFELARRVLKAGIRGVGFDMYPLPGGKIDGNNSIGGQISLGLVGGCNTWHSADEAGRQKIWEEHKQYTLEFIHFLRTDAAVPPQVRDQYASLGLCKDEFADTAHFPPALYVRESRRMKGQYVISQKDILDSPEKDDAIAISSFPIDSHDCQRVALKDGGVINEGTIFPVRFANPKVGYAYQVPYRAVLPKPEQCSNLLVPIALSCTHVAISSLRIEGAWMAIGQGAGIAAALAAKREEAVQALPYPVLRERLRAQGMVLDLPEAPKAQPVPKAALLPVDYRSGIVLDDARAELAGDWVRSTNFKPFIGTGYVVNWARNTPGDGKASATFRFQAPKSGDYRLLMAYSAHETRARNVPMTVKSGTRESAFTVDQTAPLPAGQSFQPVGTVKLEANVESSIQIRNTGTTGFIILDAVQLVPIE
ncbi:MAG: FAD-dependent oxidoreductase, partial [Verrucomicrobiae bacterium]|nr:FAD-dependent oxidoreductase [Verrucomicrobiae bacterium]